MARRKQDLDKIYIKENFIINNLKQIRIMKKILRLRVLVAVLFTAFGVSNCFAQGDIDEQLVFLGQKKN